MGSQVAEEEKGVRVTVGWSLLYPVPRPLGACKNGKWPEKGRIDMFVAKYSVNQT